MSTYPDVGGLFHSWLSLIDILHIIRTRVPFWEHPSWLINCKGKAFGIQIKPHFGENSKR
jgi:hypothetical protein